MDSSIYQDFNSYTDGEIVNLLKESSEPLSVLYKKHKSYCINFMRKMYHDDDTIKDIYQDALIVFYEKAITPGFTLTCSIQTYLNSICRNQILVRQSKSKKYEIRDSEKNEEYLENLTDWFDDITEVNNERVKVIKGILYEMKESANRCYDILVRFFYLNNTMDKIAFELGYTNADNAKTQKYKCQERLKKEIFKRITK